MTLSATPTLAQVAAELGQPAAGFSMERIDARTLAQVSATPGAAYQMSSFAGRTCINYTVNIGTDGGNNFGFSASGSIFGGVAPTTLQGLPIEKMTYNNFNPSPIIWVIGPPAANFFYAAMYRNFAGAPAGTLPSAILKVSDATFNTIVGSSRAWQWNGRADAGSNWPGLGGQNVTVQICY